MEANMATVILRAPGFPAARSTCVFPRVAFQNPYRLEAAPSAGSEAEINAWLNRQIEHSRQAAREGRATR